MVTPELINKDKLSLSEYKLALEALCILYLADLDNINIQKCKELRDELKLESKRDEVSYAYSMSQHYFAVASFPTNERIEKLKVSYLLTDKKLKWISSWDEISFEIKSINKVGLIYIPESIVFSVYYFYYLNLKIKRMLCEEYDFMQYYGNRDRSDIEVEILKFKQNKKNRERVGGYYPKNEFESIVIDLLKYFEPIKEYLGVDLSEIDLFEKFFSGNLETFLIRPLFYKIAYVDESHKGSKEVYLQLFNLFRVIMKDKEWLSEEEFNDNKKQDRLENPIGIYNDDYNRYKISIMKSFIQNS